MGSPGELKDWLSVFSTALAIGAIVYSWLTRSGKEAGEKVNKLETRLDNAVADRDRRIDEVEDRISRVEGEMKGFPSRDQMHLMQLEMERMRGSIDVLSEKLKPVAAMASRMHEAFLEERKP